MATFVAGIFLLVVSPLQTMVRQMSQLTKLDFGSLESSGSLDKRSLVWELREVQVHFALMVRAFAFTIYRNKKLRAGQSANMLYDDGRGGTGTKETGSRGHGRQGGGANDSTSAFLPLASGGRAEESR
ncbi:hypothetical protein HKX48_004124 [Thoreauomyces humboldtii]|nr:hypothetical protein HKX48_004124 [Thoreauomyces humboldtii]